MKKSFRTLTLGLLTVGMLAACNKPAPAPNWSSDDQKTMSDNLYGVVLPYVSLGNLELKFDSAQDQVVITGDELESTAIASYAQKFTTADGWTDITPANAAYYSFEKQVNNEAGAKRWVTVQFGNEEYTPASTGGETGPSQSVANEGEAAKAKRFALYAGDPNIYDFSVAAEKLYEEVYIMTGGREITLPNFPADRYFVDYDQYENVYVYCATEDATAVATYAAELVKPANGYHVNQKESVYQAYDDSQSFVINFAYDATEKIAYFTVGNFTDWPSIVIANGIKALTGAETPDSLPAYSNFRVVFAEYDDYYEELELEILYKVAEGTSYSETTLEAAKAQYASELKAADPAFTEAMVRQEKAYVSPNQQFQVQLENSTTKQQDGTTKVNYDRFVALITAFEGADLDQWPGDQIAAFFTANDLRTPLPSGASIEAAKVFRFNAYEANPTKGTDARCTIEAYGEGLTYEAYKTILDTAANGYKYLGTQSGAYYYEPAQRGDCQVVLIPQEGGFGVIVFPKELDPNFPIDKVLAAYGYTAETNPFPSFASIEADYWEFYEQYEAEKMLVYGNFDTADDANAAVTAMTSAFDADESGWIAAGTGTYIYVADPDLSFSFSLYDEKTLSITILRAVHYTNIPSKEIVYGRLGLRMQQESAYAIVIPQASFEADWTLQATKYSNVWLAVAAFDTAEEATTASNSYIATLTASPYHSYDETYQCYAINLGSYEIDIWVSVQGTNLVLQIGRYAVSNS